MGLGGNLPSIKVGGQQRVCVSTPPGDLGGGGGHPLGVLGGPREVPLLLGAGKRGVEKNLL